MSYRASESLSAGDRSADVTPAELSSGSSETAVERPAPISHGAGASFVLSDFNGEECATYQWCRKLYYEVGDGAEIPVSPDYLPRSNDYVMVFDSSRWVAGTKDDNGDVSPFYKYNFKLRRVDEDPETGEDTLEKPPVSLNITVTPQRDDLYYWKRVNPWSHPYDCGTRIEVQSTYIESGTALVTRAVEGLANVARSISDSDRHECPESAVSVSSGELAGRIDPESARLSKAEAYYRVDIEQKYPLVKSVDDSKNLIDVAGGAEIQTRGERDSDGWAESRIVSDRWDRLGFDSQDFDRGLKVYHAEDWADRGRSDPFKHPKIEAFMGDGTAPLSEFDEVLESLRSIVVSHCEWSGVTDSDLIADDYFKPSMQPRNEYEHPQGRQDDLRMYLSRFKQEVYSMALKKGIMAPYDILSVLVENYGATYDKLVEETGFSRSNVQYHVSRLVDSGLLVTVGNPTVVCFDCDTVYDIVEETVNGEVAGYFGEVTLSSRRLGREERAEEREERRESGEAPGTYDRSTKGPHSDGSDGSTGTDGSEVSESQIPDESADDSGESEDTNPFVYLSDWDGSLLDLEHEIELPDHPREESDVRVRRFDTSD